MAIRELEQRLGQLTTELNEAEGEVSFWRSEVRRLEDDIRQAELAIVAYNAKPPEQRAIEEAAAEEEARLEAERERQDKLIKRRYGRIPVTIADYWLGEEA